MNSAAHRWIIFLLCISQVVVIFFVISHWLNVPHKKDPEIVSIDFRDGYCSRERCAVDFFALRSWRDHFAGKEIAIVGYLAISDGLLTLYPSEHDYLINNNFSSLQLRFDADDQEKLFSVFGYNYIKITALFEPVDRISNRINSVGALKGEFNVIKFPPRTSREVWADIRIDADDLR